MLAITRDDVADYVAAIFLVYLILIFIRILLSWIPRMPYYPWLRASVDFIHQVVDWEIHRVASFEPVCTST